MNRGKSSPRGFAAMPKDKAREIQSRGGISSPMQFKPGEVRTRNAGRKGGKMSRRSS